MTRFGLILGFAKVSRLKALQNPKTIHLFWGFHYIQHKHNKIKQNNHTNPTIIADFQPENYSKSSQLVRVFS